VNTTASAEAAPATTLTVRACCLILHNGQIALIHRQRPSGDQYSIPGGIVHADEQVTAALARELEEELGLDVTALPRPPELRWVQDQITTRPGSTSPFRRLHLIHVLPDLPARARNAMPATEQDAKTAPGSPGRPSARQQASTCTPPSAQPSRPPQAPAASPPRYSCRQSPTRASTGASPQRTTPDHRDRPKHVPGSLAGRSELGDVLGQGMGTLVILTQLILASRAEQQADQRISRRDGLSIERVSDLLQRPDRHR